MADAKHKQRLPLDAPPSLYYKTDWERTGSLNAAKVGARSRGGATGNAGRMAITAGA